MKEYIIVGDTKDYEGCLIYVCGRNKEHAEDVLKRVIESPSESDRKATKGHSNLRLKEVVSEDCWWNDPFLAN